MRAAKPPLSANEPRENSVELLRRARAGDDDARRVLFERYVPPFHRWARGRFRDLAKIGVDTEDLVQDVLVKTLQHLDDFHPRAQGALQLYMRTALYNRIRDEVRKTRRRFPVVTVNSRQRNQRPSPSAETIGREAIQRYEKAFRRLSAGDRQAIVARMELRQSWKEVAEVLDKPSPDAARMAVSRALRRLAREMTRLE